MNQKSEQNVLKSIKIALNDTRNSRIKSSIKIKDKSSYGSDQDSLNYYTSNRNKIGDLYKSEKKFFLEKIKNCNSFLDFGCATGGFCEIIDSIKKKHYKYTGIDVSSNMVSIAREKYPKYTFKVCNGKTFPSNISKHDLTFSFGTLHHSDNYLKIIDQMLRITKKYTIFDLRFTPYKSLINRKISFQKIKFGENFIKNNNISYNILNFREFINDIVKITSKKYSIMIYGYYHKPHINVVTPYKKITMATVLINKLDEFNLNIDLG